MSDAITPVPVVPPAVPETVDGTPEGTPPEPKVLTTEELLEANRSKNAEAKSLRDRLRAAEQERDSLRTAADALKPEAQLEKERIQALEAERTTLTEQVEKLTRATLIARVQVATKLPAELAELLQGTTEEELTQHATRLAALVVPLVPEAPKPNPGQGIPSGTPSGDRQAQAKAWLSTVPGLNL